MPSYFNNARVMERKMKIAMLLPSLDNKGSLIVAKDIVNNTISNFPNFAEFQVFYFDDKRGLNFNCKTTKIDFRTDFSFLDFDIVHSHGFRTDKFLFKNRRFISASRICTIHCDVFEDLRYSYNRIISLIFGRKWIKYLSHMDKVVCLTQYHKNFYSKYFNSDKIRVISNARLIDDYDIPHSDQLLFKSIRESNPGKKIIASFAVLNRRKGLHQVIEALEDLPNLVYVIIGNGPMEDKLKELAKKLQVDDRCYFVGYKKDANRYMDLIDLFILPSYSEAFPLSLIEACYSAKPSICSNLPVLKEVYSEGEVSFFELDQKKSLIKAILRASENQKELGEKAKEKTKKLYGMRLMIKNYKELYLKMKN